MELWDILFYTILLIIVGNALFCLLLIITRYGEIIQSYKTDPKVTFTLTALWIFFFVNCHVYQFLPDRDLGFNESFVYWMKMILQNVVLVAILLQMKFQIDPIHNYSSNCLKGMNILVTGGSSGIG
jgi:FtsH-binding integral membrane protein